MKYDEQGRAEIVDAVKSKRKTTQHCNMEHDLEVCDHPAGRSSVCLAVLLPWCASGLLSGA